MTKSGHRLALLIKSHLAIGLLLISPQSFAGKADLVERAPQIAEQLAERALPLAERALKAIEEHWHDFAGIIGDIGEKTFSITDSHAYWFGLLLVLILAGICWGVVYLHARSTAPLPVSTESNQPDKDDIHKVA
jgi:hypothetical protein